MNISSLITAQSRLKRSRRVSYLLSGWLETAYLNRGEGGTTSVTIGCPDDFYAVRIGFPNTTVVPWRVNRLIGCSSSSFNDYVNPIGVSDWVQFSSGSNCENSDEIVNLRADRGDEIIVSGLASQHTDDRNARPRWTWTNWAPIRSLTPDPRTKLRVLMLRALIPSEQSVCYSVGQMRSLLGQTQLNAGFDYFIGGLKFDMDRVSSVIGSETTQSWIDNQLTVGSLIPAVQFLTKNPGITGILVGDSHQQGTSTKEQVSNFLYRAVTMGIARNVGITPLGYVNAAQGGLSSLQFFARMSALIDVVRPSYVVLPGWTYNDRIGDEHANQVVVDLFFARLLLAAEHCESKGVLPIFTTPFPRDAKRMGPTQLKPWLWLREQILGLRAVGATVFDTSAVLSKFAGDSSNGTYRLEYSTDGAHPDDAGHAKVAELFEDFFKF